MAILIDVSTLVIPAIDIAAERGFCIGKAGESSCFAHQKHMLYTNKHCKWITEAITISINFSITDSRECEYAGEIFELFT